MLIFSDGGHKPENGITSSGWNISIKDDIMVSNFKVVSVLGSAYLGEVAAVDLALEDLLDLIRIKPKVQVYHSERLQKKHIR